MNIKTGLFLLCLIASIPVLAKSDVKPVSLDISQAGFAVQKENVLNAIGNDENYSEISKADSDKIKEGLSLLSEKITDDTSFAALSVIDREQVLSHQKLINQLLVKAARDSKIVCRDEGVSGSNLPRKVCRTRAAHRLFAEQQREELQKSLNGSNRANTRVSDATKSN